MDEHEWRKAVIADFKMLQAEDRKQWFMMLLLTIAQFIMAVLVFTMLVRK